MVNATENLCVCALGMFFNQGLLTVYSMYFSFLSFTMLSILNGKTHDIKQNVFFWLYGGWESALVEFGQAKVWGISSFCKATRSIP